jgi:hypothetical protein
VLVPLAVIELLFAVPGAALVHLRGVGRGCVRC